MCSWLVRSINLPFFSQVAHPRAFVVHPSVVGGSDLGASFSNLSQRASFRAREARKKWGQKEHRSKIFVLSAEFRCVELNWEAEFLAEFFAEILARDRDMIKYG